MTRYERIKKANEFFSGKQIPAVGMSISKNVTIPDAEKFVRKTLEKINADPHAPTVPGSLDKLKEVARILVDTELI